VRRHRAARLAQEEAPQPVVALQDLHLLEHGLARRRLDAVDDDVADLPTRMAADDRDRASRQRRVASATNVATRFASAPVRIPGGMRPVRRPPAAMALSTRVSVGRSWSRFGPAVPFVPTADSVWQKPHSPTNSSAANWRGVMRFAGLGFGAGVFAFGFGVGFTVFFFGGAGAILAAIRGGALWCGPGVHPLSSSPVKQAHTTAIPIATIVARRDSRSSAAGGSSTGSEGGGGGGGATAAAGFGFARGFGFAFAISGRPSS
jgi:hypothetical protein